MPSHSGPSSSPSSSAENSCILFPGPGWLPRPSTWHVLMLQGEVSAFDTQGWPSVLQTAERRHLFLHSLCRGPTFGFLSWVGILCFCFLFCVIGFCQRSSCCLMSPQLLLNPSNRLECEHHPAIKPSVACFPEATGILVSASPPLSGPPPRASMTRSGGLSSSHRLAGASVPHTLLLELIWFSLHRWTVG